MLEHNICGDIDEFERQVIRCVRRTGGGEVKEIHSGGMKR